MSKVFLKKGELVLVNGGYLSRIDTKAPVGNYNFVLAQQHAEYIVTFAKMAKGKNFKEVKADSLDDLKREVIKAIDANQAITFLDKPSAIKRPTTDALAKEAMSFMKFNEESTKVDKINAFMQQFAVLQEFEAFGLFFDEEIVKLNNIYSVEEILKAVKETIDLLD
jgi:hypothetical protein